MHRWALTAILTAQVALGCRCIEILDPSQAYASSELVFAGTVQAIYQGESPVANHDIWRRLAKRFQLSPEEVEQKLWSKAPEDLPFLRAYLEQIVPIQHRPRLAAAKTRAELEALGEQLGQPGMRTRLRVDEVWKGRAPASVDLWQEVSSCSAFFERGEVVLVYASRREDGKWTSGVCSRGGPISHAGDDLAYLYFVKNQPAASTRLFGTVTIEQPDPSKPTPLSPPRGPALNLTVELEAPSGLRTTSTSENSKFLFDGLTAGQYKLTFYEGWNPDNRRIVGGPMTLNVPARSYLKQDIYIPPDRLRDK